MPEPSFFGLRLGAYVRDLLDLPRDVVVAWRNERLAGVADELRHRTLDRVFRRTRFMLLEQQVADFCETPRPPGVEIEVFTGPDWSPLRPITTARTRRRFARAAGRGRTCFVAWRGGRAIGYTWLSKRMDPDIETYPLPLPRDTAYAWDLYVTPSERGNGVGSALVSARMAHAWGEGFRRAWRIVARENRASLRTAEKTGGVRVVGEARFDKLLGRVRTSYLPRVSVADSEGR